MSGRAGRRGKDDRGIVIQMLDEKMEPDVAKGMIYGASDPLYSSYHVSYNMVLNMLRVEDADPENLLKSSFYQYQREKCVPELERLAEVLHSSHIHPFMHLLLFIVPHSHPSIHTPSLTLSLTHSRPFSLPLPCTSLRSTTHLLVSQELTREATNIAVDDEAAVMEYHAWTQLLARTKEEICHTLRQPEHCVPFMQVSTMQQLHNYDTNPYVSTS